MLPVFLCMIPLALLLGRPYGRSRRSEMLGIAAFALTCALIVAGTLDLINIPCFVCVRGALTVFFVLLETAASFYLIWAPVLLDIHLLVL